MKFFDLMKEAANEVGLELTEVQYEQFIKYMRLLQEWNEKINLTAITEDEEVIKKHFIDCIKAFKSDAIKNARNIIDVGTGAVFLSSFHLIVVITINHLLIRVELDRADFCHQGSILWGGGCGFGILPAARRRRYP